MHSPGDVTGEYIAITCIARRIARAMLHIKLVDYLLIVGGAALVFMVYDRRINWIFQ